MKDPVELVEATQLASREIKRRERARAKEIVRHRDAISRNLERIQGVSREEPLPAALDGFRVDGHRLLRNYHEVQIDAVAEEDGWKVVGVIAEATLNAVAVFYTANIAARKAAPKPQWCPTTTRMR